MNERIKELAKQAFQKCIDENGFLNNTGWRINPDHYAESEVFEKFAELIVQECIEQIHLECEDFENGNCFADDELWQLVTREYGKNKERGFNPVGMSLHFDKMLKKHFGVLE